MESNPEDWVRWQQKVTDFTPWYSWVVDWNKKASPGKEYSSEDIENQWKLVKEEQKELFEAFDNRDSSAFYKELCDLFVVSSFFSYLVKPELKPQTVYSEYITQMMSNLEDHEERFDRSTYFSEVMILMNSVDVNTLSRTMGAVLRSNDTKFFEWQYQDIEIAYALKVHGGRYDGIHVKRTVDGLATLRDGNNKILKPSTYKPYIEFLGWTND